MVFLGKVGVGITQEHLLEQEYQKYDLVFLLLDPEDEYEGTVEELPAETCVTIRFCGSRSDAPGKYRMLADYMEEHQLQIVGFSREITLIDYGLTSNKEQFVTEIQIPVLQK